MLNPDIDDRKINIDYLGDGMEYSIDPIRSGSCLQEIHRWNLPEAVSIRIYKQGKPMMVMQNRYRQQWLYQAFEEWVESNNMNDVFPELDGHDAIRVEVLQSGYLFSTEADLGRYQMICRVIYR